MSCMLTVLRTAVCVAGALCAFWHLFNVYLLLDEIQLHDARFLDLHRCPFCYGLDFCTEFDHSKTAMRQFDIDFELILLNTFLLQPLFNVKNVYFGVDNLTRRRLILKKLAHKSELAEFDRHKETCDHATQCFGKVMRRFPLNVHFNGQQMRDISEQLQIEATACFTDRLAALLYARLKPQPVALKQVNTMLLTTLQINPEPIVLQMFRNEDGWPFPMYYGSCGRVIVESNEGRVLADYMERPFLFRLMLAKKLLDAIALLYDNVLEVAIYLTDLGFENIAYNEHSARIYFIDVENIIISDRQHIRMKNPSSWNASHYVHVFDDCAEFGDCLSYSVRDMCHNYHVDINIYSVCRNILSQFGSDKASRRNLLHSIPADIDAKYSLNKLLNKCANIASSNDKPPLYSRFDLARELMKMFDQILKNKN